MSLMKSHPKSHIIMRKVDDHEVKFITDTSTEPIFMNFNKDGFTVPCPIIVLQVEVSGDYVILEIVKESDYNAAKKETEAEDTAQEALGTNLLQRTHPDSYIRCYEANSWKAQDLFKCPPVGLIEGDEEVQVKVLQVMAYGENLIFEFVKA